MPHAAPARRMLALASVLSAGAVAALAGAGPAAADDPPTDPTATSAPSISNPNGRYFMLQADASAGTSGSDLGIGPRQPVRASYNVTGSAPTTDASAVYCYHSLDPTSYSGAFPSQTGDGPFNAYQDPIGLAATNTYGEECHYRAVPSSAPDSADTTDFPFSPDVTDIGIFAKVGLDLTHPAGGLPLLGLAVLPAPAAGTTIAGPHPTGVLAQSLPGVDNAFGAATSFWEGAGALPAVNTGAPVPHSAIQVDGHDAFEPAGLMGVLGSPTPDAFLGLFSGITTSAVRDPATGDFAMTSQEPIIRCLDGAGHPIDGSGSIPACSSLADTGVRLATSWTVTQAGVLASFTDKLTSVSGQHSVTLSYLALGPAGAGFQVPGDVAPAAPAADRDLTTGTWPAQGTIFGVADPSAAPTGSTTHPAVELTYSARPDSAHIYHASSELELDYTRTVSAVGRPFTLSQSFSTHASLAAAVTTASGVVTQQKPSLALSGVPSVVGSKSVAVHGTFTPGGNGVPDTATVGSAAGSVSVPVADDGTFTANVPLTLGSNTITALGTDSGGQAATASASVTFTMPVSAGAAKVAKVVKAISAIVAGKTVTTKRITKATITVPVTCAAFGPTAGCAVTVKDVVAGKGTVLGSKTATVARGTTAKVVLTLPAATLKKLNAVKKGKHLDSSVQVTYADPAGGTLAVAPKKLRLV